MAMSVKERASAEHELRQAIEQEGGVLLGKPEGLIQNFAFESGDKVSSVMSNLMKKFPVVDFYKRGRRLLVYGVVDLGGF